LEENDGMEDLGVDAIILLCILSYYCRREGIGWFHLPLEHTITNLLLHESSEILKMLLASQGQFCCLALVTAYDNAVYYATLAPM
jgi:hypothetical protein